MKASQLIKILEERIKQHGDLPVLYEQDGFGGHADHLIVGVAEHDTDTYMSEDYISDPEEKYKELNIDFNQNYGTFKALILKGELINAS
jgi:hypothetical protein